MVLSVPSSIFQQTVNDACTLPGQLFYSAILINSGIVGCMASASSSIHWEDLEMSSGKIIVSYRE